jgi:hypothetical protein
LSKSYYVETRDKSGNDSLQFSTHTQAAVGPQMMSPAHIHNYIEILFALSGKYQIL